VKVDRQPGWLPQTLVRTSLFNEDTGGCPEDCRCPGDLH
jgi:hypothetical protein